MRRLITLCTALTVAMLTAGAASGAAVQKFTITMRDFRYTPAKFTVTGGIPVEITLVNKGRVTHEFMLYDMPKGMGAMLGHNWVAKTNYFRGLPVKVTGGVVERRAGSVFEIEVKAGKSATVQFTPMKKGSFEFGCMVEGHYEAGQKGVLVVK